MRKLIIIILTIIIWPSISYGQNALHTNVAQGNVSGYVTVLPAASITVTPSTSVFSSAGSTTPAIQPFIADANGNYSFYGATCTTFTITITAAGFPGYTYNWTSPLANGGTCNNIKGISGIVYIDSSNVQGWNGVITCATDLGACVNSAYSSLPSCIDSGLNGGPNTFAHCGKIILSPGNYTWSSQQTITSPFISLECQISDACKITYTGTNTSSCALNVTSSPFSTNETPGQYSGFSLIGNSTANICGIKFYDILGFQLDNVTIAGFTGAGSSGLIQLNVAAHTERAQFRKLWLNNNAIGWNQQMTIGNPNNTFGYGNFDVYCATNAGQTCIQSSGLAGTAHSLIFDNSNFHLISNINGAGTCFAISNNADWDLLYNVECEQTASSGGIFRTMDVTSTWQGIGIVSNFGLTDNANLTGHRDTAFSWSHTGGVITNGLQMNFTNPFPATVTTPQNAACYLFQGQYWTGSASALDQWQTCPAIGVGANPPSMYQFIHTGSSGAAEVQMPKLNLPATSGGGNVTVGFGTASDFPVVNFPDVSATLEPQPTTFLKNGSGSGNYTGVNTASLASLDTTNLCQIVTVPTGWKLIIQATGNITTLTAVAIATVGITDVGTTCAGAGVTPLKQESIQASVASAQQSFALGWVLNGDGAAHSISIQASTTNAGDSWSVQNSSISNSPSLILQLVMSN